MLRRFNELLHRVASYALSILEGDEQRLPDDVLISMIVEELRALGVDHHWKVCGPVLWMMGSRLTISRFMSVELL